MYIFFPVVMITFLQLYSYDILIFVEVTGPYSSIKVYLYFALVEMITFWNCVHIAEIKWMLVELLHLSINPLINAATRS